MISETLHIILDLVGNESNATFHPYSGRSMYGAKCLSIYLSRNECAALGERLRERKVPYRTDSMGLGMVLYFPQIDATECQMLFNRNDREGDDT